MKKTITTLFLTTAIALGFAQEQTLTANAFAQPVPHTPVASNDMQVGTLYIKMGANETDFPKNGDHIMPELGVGYRVSEGHHGLDVSADGSLRKARSDDKVKESNYFYSLPKVDYLFYATPASNSSFYAGTGLAWGGLLKNATTTVAPVATDAAAPATTPAVESDKQEFHGIVPNIVAGYEFNRRNTVKTFVQLELSQPAVAVYKEGAFPGPRASLFVGAGF